MRLQLLAIAVCMCSCALAQEPAWDKDRCTAMVVGKKATVDGSTMTTHTVDCAECDWRFSKVPARDWPEGSMRPIYLFRSSYPTKVAEDRGYTWSVDNLEDLPQKKYWMNDTGEILGYIPQVPHTYALLEGVYGLMNEHQVAIGESTCAAKLWTKPIGNGGVALFEVNELTQVALERSTTARDAIKLMGELATTYGYYSCDWTSPGDGTLGEAGEALTVIDKEEAWMFHIMPDDTGTSAIWVAQRVPDDHICVVANTFVIRRIDPDSPDFLYSDNVWEVAKRQGWWNESMGQLDWLYTYSPMRAHSEYSTNRVWRVFSLAAPSSNLPPNTDYWGNDYPFSIKVDYLLSPQDLMRFQRDHFEGSVFDMTKGLASGPYGDPNRWGMAPRDNMTIVDELQGSFRRAISLFRTSYAFVAQGRMDKPDILARVWLCQYAPSSSVFIPLYVAVTELPKAWIKGSFFKYDPDSMFWMFLIVGNYCGRFYQIAMQDVWKAAAELEKKFLADVEGLENGVMNVLQFAPESLSAQIVTDSLTDFVIEAGELVHSTWKALFNQVVTRFHDGYIFSNLDQPKYVQTKVFYPKWWLQAVGYFDHPPNPHGILFEPSPIIVQRVSRFVYVRDLVVSTVACVLGGIGVGFFVAKYTYNRRNYVVIPL